MDICTKLKNENTSKNAKNNLKNTKYQNSNWRGPSFYSVLPRGEGRPLPPVSEATDPNVCLVIVSN